MPVELGERLESADKLSDDDRAAIIEMARKAIEPFLTHLADATQPSG